MAEFKIEIDPSQLARLSACLKAMRGRLPRLIRKALGKAASTAVRLMREELEPMRYRGELIRSVKPEFVSNFKVSIYPAAPHAIFVRLGTAPHTPPWAPIEAWAEKKGLPPGPIWQSIRRQGTSRFAKRKYGEKGNPFPLRTARRPELERALLKAAQEAGVEMFMGVQL